MKSIKTYLKAIFLFSPGKPKDPFILEAPSKDEEQDSKKDSEQGHGGIYEHGAEKEDDIRRNKMKKESEDKEKGDIKEQEKRRSKENIPSRKPVIQPIPLEEKDNAHSDKKEDDDIGDIHASIKDCLEKIKSIYTADINGDFKIREFRIRVKGKIYSAFVCFFDGMIDRLLVNISILQPLMTLSTLPIDTEEQSVQEVIYNHLMPQNQIKTCKTYQEVVDEVNFGGIGIFIDSLGVAFSGDVKGWEHRTVDKPTSELNIRGPKEAFNETNRMNTALLRKTLKDENLIVEDVLIGTRSKTPCSIVYIKNLANSSLVDEVRRRMKSIKVGYLQDSGELEQLLEDSTFLPAPQMLLTERPDRVASYLGEGRVGIIVHGSPYVIIAPVTLFNLIHSPEDSYLRYPYATLLRFIRIMGILFTLLLPSIYLAITNFHQEMLPTDLLLAIASSREKVPFPTIVSILIMELAFELIREAGIRIPGPIGTTLGIVGALILGQAAVSANLVSPILIIIVAVTGIGSFAIPDFSLGYSFRAIRFIYLLLASISGLLGIALGIFVYLLFLAHAHSFGVPFLVPFAPKTTGKRTNTIFKTPLWKEEDRPDFLNPKAVRKQPSISRGWVIKEKGVIEDGEKNKDR
ncbi:MAG: spore germination protein [Clostridiaceae bacterium]|nr:spore germination protein [Clostridiaceae bacterium]